MAATGVSTLENLVAISEVHSMAMQVVCMWDDLEEKLEAKDELLAAMDVKKRDIEKATRLIRLVLDKSHDARQDIYNALRQQQQLQENHAAEQLLRVIEDTPGASSYP